MILKTVFNILVFKIIACLLVTIPTLPELAEKLIQPACKYLPFWSYFTKYAFTTYQERGKRKYQETPPTSHLTHRHKIYFIQDLWLDRIFFKVPHKVRHWWSLSHEKACQTQSKYVLRKFPFYKERRLEISFEAISPEPREMCSCNSIFFSIASPSPTHIHTYTCHIILEHFHSSQAKNL